LATITTKPGPHVPSCFRTKIAKSQNIEDLKHDKQKITAKPVDPES
jgi:hypothetical protein